MTVSDRIDLRDYGRFLDLPAPDPEPKHEEYFAEGRDEGEGKVGIRKKGDVLHRLIGVARPHQLRVNRKLGVADRIE